MKKELDLREDYVTCITCDVCYDQQGAPTFCQKYSSLIDPKNILGNQSKAQKCSGWFPRAVGRVNCGKDYDKDDKRWYEKDSMA